MAGSGASPSACVRAASARDAAARSLNVGLSVYLPILLVLRGYSFEEGGIGIALWSGAGVFGALLGGTLSDRIGRTRMLLIAISTAASLLFVLLYALERGVAAGYWQ